MFEADASSWLVLRAQCPFTFLHGISEYHCRNMKESRRRNIVQGTDDFNDRHKPQRYAGMMHSPSRVLHVFAWFLDMMDDMCGHHTVIMRSSHAPRSLTVMYCQIPGENVTMSRCHEYFHFLPLQCTEAIKQLVVYHRRSGHSVAPLWVGECWRVRDLKNHVSRDVSCCMMLYVSYMEILDHRRMCWRICSRQSRHI